MNERVSEQEVGKNTSRLNGLGFKQTKLGSVVRHFLYWSGSQRTCLAIRNWAHRHRQVTNRMERTSDVWLRLALFLGLVLAVQCRPDGAPLGTCTTMTPGHGTEQTAASPYNVTVTVDSYAAGTPVQVTIRGTFQGLLLQARAVGSNVTVGTFTDPGAASNLRLLNCGGVTGSAVTHARTDAKTDSVLMWNPPSTAVGNVEFVATVAQAKSTWWRMNKSSALAADESYTTVTAPPTQTNTVAPQTTDGDNSNTATTTVTAHGSYMFSAVSLLLTFVCAL